MKNKKIYIVIGVIVILLALAGFMLNKEIKSIKGEKLYKVGKHIDAGEYVLVGKGKYTIAGEVIDKDYGNYEVCTAKSCNADKEEVILNDNVFGKAYVILEEGQYLKVQNMELHKVDEYETKLADEISYNYSLGFESYYKVGKDLSAGTYTFTGDTFSYEVCTKPSCNISFDILDNEVITSEFIDKEDEKNTATVTLEEGQYLLISGTEPFTVVKEK